MKKRWQTDNWVHAQRLHTLRLTTVSWPHNDAHTHTHAAAPSGKDELEGFTHVLDFGVPLQGVAPQEKTLERTLENLYKSLVAAVMPGDGGCSRGTLDGDGPCAEGTRTSKPNSRLLATRHSNEWNRDVQGPERK